MKELAVELADRKLRFDGVSVLPPEFVEDFLRRGLKPSQLRLSSTSPEIEEFNSFAGDEALKLETPEPVTFSFDWQIPARYLELDVAEHVQTVFSERFHELAYDATQEESAFNRVARELEEFERRGLNDLLRVIIYVLDRFREAGQVYGVGRGSSCASFVLFLLGLHVVDPIKFDVPLEEFMHD